jgi:glycosyltransferase involved in cell wall biosynthesis
MHICHCFKDFSLAEGGVERYIRYLSNESIRAGHKVSVVVSRPPGSPGREISDGIEEIRTRPFFTIFKVPIMPSYYRCLSSVNPDIVHAHGTLPGVSDIAVMYAARNNKPSVFDYQFDGNAESAIGNLFAAIYNRFINPIAVSSASKVTATSISYAQTSPVLKHYLNKIEVVPNGVDLEHFNPAVKEGNIREKYQLPAENIVFFAGRFVKYKGLEYLIRAMKYVKDGTLVIAGIGPEEQNLKRIIKEQNITNIRFLGLIPHEELPYFYKISDVYVLPSITRGENFGIAALEAMACGTPVVASALPGVRELVTDACGIKFKPKDIKGLADAINTLLSNSSLRAKMGKSARENAEKYGWDVIAKMVLDIYQDLSR